MEAAVTSAPARKSWRWLAVGLIAFFLLPKAFEVWIAMIDTASLLVPIVAVCALIGWLAGGKPLLAVLWVGLAIPFLVLPGSVPGAAFNGMARGWALILAGSFGLVSIWNNATPFFVRALEAVGLAIAAGFLLAISSPGGTDRFQRVAAEEYGRRAKEAVAVLDTPFFRSLSARSPDGAKVAEMEKEMISASAQKSAILLPAVLALESLVALALGWAMFERLGTHSIGPDLSPLREFKFSDQLVWGVAVGATLLMLPAFEEGRNAGLNLLIFFGALYVVRGFGVMAWMSSRHQKVILGMFASAFVVALVAPSVGSPLLFVMIAFVLLGAIVLGLGDTWLDWRRRPTAG